MLNKSQNRWKVFCNVNLTLNENALIDLEKVADITHFPARQETLLQNIEYFDAYYASHAVEVNKAILLRAKKLKVIAVAGTGCDHIDIGEAELRGVQILNIAKDMSLLEGFSATAELAWALLLGCMRKLPAAFDSAKHGYWARERFVGHQLRGKTLGIIGLGRLGAMVADYGNAFKMNVLGCDVLRKNIAGVKQVALDQLLGQSDVISIHIHLTEDNRHLLSNQQFKLMKKGVIIINTSRGGIINETSLLESLESGHVSAAGLDVVDGEWDSQIYDHPLIEYARTHDNLVVTPHIGGATVESIIGAREFMANKLASYIQKQAIA